MTVLHFSRRTTLNITNTSSQLHLHIIRANFSFTLLGTQISACKLYSAHTFKDIIITASVLNSTLPQLTAQDHCYYILCLQFTFNEMSTNCTWHGMSVTTDHVSGRQASELECTLCLACRKEEMALEWT